jgi:serine phosphatase RsbU (regulator of sigma subunit)
MDMACLEHKKFFLKKSKSSFIDEVKRIRKIVYTNCNTGNFNISPNHWVDMINGKINLLKEVEIKISRELLESALKLKKKCQNELTLYIILIFVFTALILIFLYKIIFSITSPLEKLSMIAGKVSQGDMSSKASIDSNCEIGLLAKVFNEMIDNILERVKSEEQKKIKLADTMEKINLELDIAMRLQHELLPANFSDFPEVNIQCRFIPYRKVGGDLYDVWRLDKSKICFLIFDISGHGVAAALLTTVSKQSFRKNISSDLPIEKCVEKVNSELLSFFSDNQFLTAIVCVLETDKGVLTVCQCGHPTIYIHKRNTKKLIQTNECNCAIGFFEDWEFTSKSFSIDSGDRFYLYTDGLVDTKNMNKERYEHERLERIILSNELSFDKQVQGIMDDVDCFREDMDQADDLTLMCVELL